MQSSVPRKVLNSHTWPVATALDGVDTEHSIRADIPLASTAQTIPENPMGSHKEENLTSCRGQRWWCGGWCPVGAVGVLVLVEMLSQEEVVGGPGGGQSSTMAEDGAGRPEKET